jgi:phosphotransferase system  glucose/maltose/N-acetylglucosamine-specific IIC component
LQFDSIFSTILGISTLNTSVFGGVIVGAVVAYLYNRFKNIQLPTYIGFFSGVRFIPIITFITSLLIGLMFAII